MRIMVYGDSNSWGYLDDDSGLRCAGRWPQQMRRAISTSLAATKTPLNEPPRNEPSLGPIEVVEECLPGRVTHGIDPVEGPQFDGAAPLLAILMSHQPLDRVIFMLGTNDLKARFNRTPNDIAMGVIRLVDIVHASAAGPGGWGAATIPAITVICPPMLGARADDPTWIRHEEWRGGLEKSKLLPRVLGEACALRGLDFIDANDGIQSSNRDPIHWRAESHTDFGAVMASHLLNLTKE